MITLCIGGVFERGEVNSAESISFRMLFQGLICVPRLLSVERTVTDSLEGQVAKHQAVVAAPSRRIESIRNSFLAAPISRCSF